jgi:hypothetical protein
MSARPVLVVLGLLVCGAAAQAEEPAALARARALYNASDYSGAIGEAATARLVEEYADAAALVLARAHLERYRMRTDPADLSAARAALGSVRYDSLDPRDQVDLIIGMGQSLYLGEVFGGAAYLFDSALAKGAVLARHDRLTLLDWWATALDREAQTRPPDRRPQVYERIADRMDDELREDPGSAVANYWRAVAARGRGDLDDAWDLAVAGWVGSRLAPETTERLRADLDRLVTQALIPELSRRIVAPDPQEARSRLRTEWELVKESWP